jgi:thioredoxin-like negative regulator of GroEL
MRYFWQGFRNKTSAAVQFKKHVLVLYWEKSDARSEQAKGTMGRLAKRYPTVRVKLIEVRKDPLKPVRHGVSAFPTVVLLKDGREVDRLAAETDGATLLEQLFRKAQT